MCKHLGFKSLVYEIDWKSHFQKFGGYYDENGNYIESNIIPSPPVSKSFWCIYGMVILGYKLNIIIFPEKVKGRKYCHFLFFHFF